MIRLKDAEVLFANERYAAAYYLAGYAVECALKACIAGLMREGDFPPEPNYLRERCYTHRLAKLLDAAELSKLFEEKAKLDPTFGNQWKTANGWSTESRYVVRDAKTAEDMIESATGVVECIRQYW